MMPPSSSSDDRIRRSLDQEFVRMENDFDGTRDHRGIIVDKLMEAVQSIKLVDDAGAIAGDNESSMDIIKTTLKALADVEKSTSVAIGLKLKNREQELASNNASKDRIAAILASSAPGKINQAISAEEIEKQLDDMFADKIEDFELKTDPRDLNA